MKENPHQPRRGPLAIRDYSPLGLLNPRGLPPDDASTVNVTDLQNIFHHGIISARGFHPALFLLLSAASSLGRLPTYIALKPDPGSQRQSKQGETRGTDARPAAF